MRNLFVVAIAQLVDAGEGLLNRKDLAKTRRKRYRQKPLTKTQETLSKRKQQKKQLNLHKLTKPVKQLLKPSKTFQLCTLCRLAQLFCCAEVPLVPGGFRVPQALAEASGETGDEAFSEKITTKEKETSKKVALTISKTNMWLDFVVRNPLILWNSFISFDLGKRLVFLHFMGHIFGKMESKCTVKWSKTPHKPNKGWSKTGKKTDQNHEKTSLLSQ